MEILEKGNHICLSCILSLAHSLQDQKERGQMEEEEDSSPCLFSQDIDRQEVGHQNLNEGMLCIALWSLDSFEDIHMFWHAFDLAKKKKKKCVLSLDSTQKQSRELKSHKNQGKEMTEHLHHKFHGHLTHFFTLAL